MYVWLFFPLRKLWLFIAKRFYSPKSLQIREKVWVLNMYTIYLIYNIYNVCWPRRGKNGFNFVRFSNTISNLCQICDPLNIRYVSLIDLAHFIGRKFFIAEFQQWFVIKFQIKLIQNQSNIFRMIYTKRWFNSIFYQFLYQSIYTHIF